jgi:hypothetical protein
MSAPSWLPQLFAKFYNTLFVGGTQTPQEPSMNLVAGENVTISYADNPPEGRTDVTISAGRSFTRTASLTGRTEGGTYGFVSFTPPAGLYSATVRCMAKVTTAGAGVSVGDSAVTVAEAVWSTIGDTVTLVPQTQGEPSTFANPSMAGVTFSPGVGSGAAQVDFALPAMADDSTVVAFSISFEGSDL